MILQTEENPIFLSVFRADRVNTDRWSVFILSPHRGEWRKDRPFPTQCARTALSSAGSAVIPAEQAEVHGVDHY